MNETNTNETSFTIHEKGEITGSMFDGVFKTKLRLSFRDRLRRDQLRRQYLGEGPVGAPIDPDTASTATIFSELGVRLLDAPKWWRDADSGVDLHDDNIAIAVYQKALKAESDAIKALAGAGERAKTEVVQKTPPPTE